MAKTKASKPKVSDKEVKEIYKKHKPANRNETYTKKTLDIVKMPKTKASAKKSGGKKK